MEKKIDTKLKINRTDRNSSRDSTRSTFDRLLTGARLACGESPYCSISLYFAPHESPYASLLVSKWRLKQVFQLMTSEIRDKRFVISLRSKEN